MTVSSLYKFINPIREFKENDPYFFGMDNVPIQQLQQNCLWLKDQIDSAVDTGTIDRASFSELKPYVNGSDNVVRVKPGRYTARINDAYNKTPLQKIKLLTDYLAGNFRQYTNTASFATSSVEAIVDALNSSLAASALNMNGLAERVFQIRITDPDHHLTTTTLNGNPSTGPDEDKDKWPGVTLENFRKLYTQNYGLFFLQQLSSEFIKMWRGVARTAIVDVPSELDIDIPAFDENDFKQYDPNTGATVLIPGVTTRVDLVFIYSHPIDTNSTTIHKYTGGTPQTINTPILGVLRGAGAVIKKTLTADLVSPIVVEGAIDSDGNSQMLASPGDQNSSNNGFSSLNIHGSFPSPDDLMNIAPNLIESLESNDYQLIGQSILPICYVVVRKGSSVNAAGQPVLNTNDLVDIRPFFRTAELTYNERAGICAASPPISLGNPAVGQFQLDYVTHQLYQRVRSELGGEASLVPRVVGGGLIWGGTKFGAEGAVRLAAKLLAGISEANLPHQDAPTYPDWDLAEWWTLFSPNVNDIGQRRNDRVNLHRIGRGRFFDSGTNPTDDTDITTAERKMGSEHKSGLRNAYTLHWCKKEILIDRAEIPWMDDYTVECEFLNCIPQSTRASTSENDSHEDEAGSAGIWVEKKFDRFVIYVGWVADTPNKLTQANTILHGKEPKDDRDTYGFSGFAVRTTDMGLPSVNNMFYDNAAQSKAPNIGVCTYPSISFKITGYPAGYFYKNLAQYPQTSLIYLK